MTVPAQWEGPPTEAGPAPGIEFATPGSRLMGYIIDVIVIIGAVLCFAFLGVILGAMGFDFLTTIVILVSIVIPIVYFPYFWKTSGQTPGAKMAGVKVVRDKDGGPLGWGAAILRLIGYAISGMVFYIGFIWIFVDKRKRGWFDLIAGTVAIKAAPEEYEPDVTRPTYGGHMGDPGDPGRLPD
jgi:uncharacterized RDD family membrane protein YckC